MKKKLSLFLLLLSILFFLILKLSYLSVRISDTNLYFYHGYKLLTPQLLYKDTFFFNLPLFAYISSIYYLITSGDIVMFYATALLEVAVITFLTFFIVYTKTKNYTVSVISSLLYMFSSIVLVTSDHQTGVFTASIFIVLSYLFLEKKYFLISGVFAGLSLLTKAYFLPIVLSFTVYLLFIKKDYKHFFHFIAGFISSTIVIISPFLILARKEFMADLLFSLTRTGGTKQDIIYLFLRYDFILFSVFIFNLFNFKKNSLFALISLFSIAIFFFYQGLYYLYLNFIIPFLAISFYNLSHFLVQKRHLLKIVLPMIVLFAIGINIVMYVIHFSNLGSVENIDTIIKLIKKENPKYLYGAVEITPALAYLSQKPLLDNIINTNKKGFIKKILDSKKLTQKAIKTKTIIVARGTYVSQLNIGDAVIDEIFDKDLLRKYCHHLASFPIYTADETNRINLLKCY